MLILENFCNERCIIPAISITGVGGVTVSIGAFQAPDLGSDSGRRKNDTIQLKFVPKWAETLVTTFEGIEMVRGKRIFRAQIFTNAILFHRK